MKNSIIILRGVKKEVHVTRREAEQIDAVYNDKEYPDDYGFQIGNISFRKGQINFIEINPDATDSSKNDDRMRKFYEDEKKLYADESSWSVEKKAANTDFFAMVFLCSCGRLPDEAERAKASEIQREFFSTHPHRRLCDFYLYIPITPKDFSKLGIFHEGGLRVAAKALFRDMQLAGQIAKGYDPKPIIHATGWESPEESRRRVEANDAADREHEAFVSKMVDGEMR